MKVYTRIVLDMTQDDMPVIEAEFEEYDGQVALCMPSDGAGGRSGGDGDRGSGGSSDSGRGGSEGGRGGFGSVDRTGMNGFGADRDAAGNATGRNADGSMADGSGRDQRMSAALAGLMGVSVTQTPAGYFDAVGNRVAYASGQPTSYGAAHAARNNDMGMSWQGAKAVSKAAMDVQAKNRQDAAKAALDQVRTQVAGKYSGLTANPATNFRGIDAALTALEEGRYAGLTDTGAMSAEQEAALRDAYEGPVERLGRAVGMPSLDITTPYDAYNNAVASGAMNPDGTLSAKGWMGVASPVMSVLAGPLGALGFQAAGLPGALAAYGATKAAQGYADTSVSSPTTSAVNAVGSLAGLGPIAGGLSYASSMADLSRAQSFAGTQPESVSSVEHNHGDGDSGGFGAVADGVTASQPVVVQPALNPHMVALRAGDTTGNPFLKFAR